MIVNACLCCLSCGVFVSLCVSLAHLCLFLSFPLPLLPFSLSGDSPPFSASLCCSPLPVLHSCAYPHDKIPREVRLLQACVCVCSRACSSSHAHNTTHTHNHTESRARAHAHAHAHTCTHARTHTLMTCCCLWVCVRGVDADCRDNDLGAEGAAALSSSLGGMTSLQTLNLE